MNITAKLFLNSACMLAMKSLCLLLFAASLTAQAQYLELSTIGAILPPTGGSAWSICADFNNNGTDDVLYVADYTLWCSAIMDPGVNGFGVAVPSSLSFPGGPSQGARWGIAAELTGDGNLDLVLIHLMNNMAVLYPGLGTGAFAASTALVLPAPAPTHVAPLDINNNGSLDLVFLQSNNPATSSIYCLQNQHPVWTTLPTQLVPNVVSFDCVGDFDGDGAKDLLLSRVNANIYYECTVAWGLGNGVFAPLAPFGTSTLPYGLQPVVCQPAGRWVGDVNNDGRDDVLLSWRCPYGPTGLGALTWQDQVYVGNANRTFTPAGSFLLPPNYGAASSFNMAHSGLHDMDMDGILDLVCNPVPFQPNAAQTAYLSQINLLIARGLGSSQFHQIPMTSLAPQVTNTSGLSLSLAHVSDFDNDGDLDVLAMNGSAPQQCFFRNRSSRGTGCSGALGTPLLGHGLAMVGNSLHSLSVSGAAPNAATVIAISLASNNSPLSACGVYLNTLANTVYLPGTTDTFGHLNWPLPIPNNPLLHALPFFAQAAVLDPLGPNLGGLNLALTPARTIFVW